MSLFRRSKLTEALETALENNRDLSRKNEELRRRADWAEDQLIGAKARLDGAEEALEETKDQLRDARKGYADLVNEHETLRTQLQNADEVLDALDRQVELADAYMAASQEQAMKDYAEWRHDWLTAREAEALEEENLRLWAENALLRAELLQATGAEKTKAAVSDRP
jgi:chromosome segregation ATPase